MKSMAAGLVVLAVFSGGAALRACPRCRPLVKSSIYNQDFAGNAFALLLPVAVLLAIGAGIYFADALKAALHEALSKGAKTWRRTFNAAR